MQTTTQDYKDLWASSHIVKVEVYIGNALFTESDIYSLKISRQLFKESAPTIGSAVAAEIDLVIKKPTTDIPKGAMVRPLVRLSSPDGTELSEWISKGVFRIDTRTETKNPYGVNTITIHGYDDMLKLDEVAGIMIAPRVFFTESLPLELGVYTDPVFLYVYSSKLQNMPNIGGESATYRDILSAIAVKLCGNFVIDEITNPSSTYGFGLKFIPFRSIASAHPIELGQSIMTFEQSPQSLPYGKVIIHTPNEDVSWAGSISGDYNTLEVTTSLIQFSNADALYILGQIEGYEYQAFEANGAILDPAAQLGDVVTVNGTTSIIATLDTNYDSLCAANISAPNGGEIFHEYNYKDGVQRELNRKVTAGSQYSGVSIDKTNGFTATCGNASVSINDGAIAFRINGNNAIYYNSSTNKFVINTSYVTIN